MGDWFTAASAYTPVIMAILQWIKQLPLWRNQWCLYAAPFFGMIVAALWLGANGQISLDGGLWFQDGLTFYKTLLQGFFAGVAAPVGYELQKHLPENARILAPGPNNHPVDAAKAAQNT